MTRRLDGGPVAERLLHEARARADAGRAAGRHPPTLVSVHVGDTGPFSFYLRQQQKAAAAAGVAFQEVTLPAGTTHPALLARIQALDADPRIDAVLLQHPLPPELDFFEAVSALRPEKDVDGVGARSLGGLVANRPFHAPAVARGALALLAASGIEVRGRSVAVLGRSQTVGLPLALLLSSRAPYGDADVTILHSRSPRLAEALEGQEIIFSCVGKPGLLNRQNVPKGAVIVDIGLSTVPDPARPSGHRAVGDADGPSLEGWAEAMSPVPGGVGPVTVAQLFWNAVDGWARRSTQGP